MDAHMHVLDFGLGPQVAYNSPNIEHDRKLHHCGYPQCEFTARAMSSVEEHYISRHTSERPFICTYNADLNHMNGGSGHCGASYSSCGSLSSHRTRFGHRVDNSESENVYAVGMARMRERYPNMVLKPSSHAFVPLTPGTPSPQASQRSKPTRHIDATVAPVPAHASAAAALSESHRYPAPRPNGSSNYPSQPSLWMDVDDRARAGSSQEGRPTLAPPSGMERAGLQLSRPNFPGNGPQLARNTLPTPNLRLPSSSESSLTSRPPRS